MPVRYPTLRSILSINYTDPSADNECRVCFEREGLFLSSDGKIIEGTYYTYVKQGLKRYVSVFIPTTVSEDGEVPVFPVAVDIKKTAAVNRAVYRNRVAHRIQVKRVEEKEKKSLDKGNVT